MPELPEWLRNSPAAEPSLNITHLATWLVIALIYGLAVAVIYRVSHGREEGSSSTLFATLVLMCVLIAMVSIVIGSSVARAFSLVGALSIVRFRTVVDDTRDTAFVIFAVVAGMAVGTGQIVLPLVAIPLVGVTAIVLSRITGLRNRVENVLSPLTVRIALGSDLDAPLATTLAKHTEVVRLKSTMTTRQGAALDLTYHVKLRPDTSMLEFVAELNRINGVMNVEMHAA